MRHAAAAIVLSAGLIGLSVVPTVLAQTADEPAIPAPGDISESPASQAEAEAEPAAVVSPPNVIRELRDLRAAVHGDPANSDLRAQLAAGLYRLGDLDAALEEIRAAVKQSPKDAALQLQLGVILIAKQDWPSAATTLMEAVLLDPALTQAHYNLGSVQYTLGNRKAAMHSYRRALELQPDFPDAQYRLALVLKLSRQQEEAARLMEQAAAGGIPQAQFFMGTAYKNGHGVPKQPANAIRWWMEAARLGHQPAADALSQLRRQALSPQQSERTRMETMDAFRAYRRGLWETRPDVARQDGIASLGVALMERHELADGLPILLTEALALSESAHERLAAVYETGLEDTVPPYDPRILACFQAIAGDGFMPAKKVLARIYAKGLGVPADPPKAKALLKTLPKADAQAALEQLSAP